MNSVDEFSVHRVRQFGELLAECHRDLFTFIYSLVQHHADAEDVYQQVAVVLWKKFDTFEIGTNFAAWATTVAHNVAPTSSARGSEMRSHLVTMCLKPSRRPIVPTLAGRAVTRRMPSIAAWRSSLTRIAALSSDAIHTSEISRQSPTRKIGRSAQSIRRFVASERICSLASSARLRAGEPLIRPVREGYRTPH